jgi:four helix bundle protein
MAGFRKFEDVQAWQRARVLVREVYEVCTVERLQREYSLRDQICRAAVSAMTNIAEGFARKGDKEFAHFLGIARGSAAEVQSLLYVVLDLGFIEQHEFEHLFALAGETAALTTRLAAYLRQPLPASSRAR